MMLTELMALWEERRAEYVASAALVSGASMISRMLRELDAALESERSEILTMAEASQLSGFSVEHLSRLVRDGRLANVGRKGAPRVRRGDLPLKNQTAMAHGGGLGYDPQTDARSLTSRR